MAFLQNRNVAIKGIAACVPKLKEENINSSVFDSTLAAGKFITTTGIERRRLSSPGITSVDLCFRSAEKLIEDLGWNKNEIDCLVFVSQTSDYILPASSCILQDKLGLSNECYTLDISLGCSGWVYAMSVISSLISNGSMKRGLLLAGDTISKLVSEKDKSTYPLFGDAGTVTALEYDTDAPELYFHLASDGSGYETIIVPDGGARNPYTENSNLHESFENNILRSRSQLSLNGMDVFSFGISKAPESVEKLLSNYSIDKESIDYYVFHQANLFMNEKIRKKLKLPQDKVLYSLKNYGNTSCATIPLTIVTELQDKVIDNHLSLVACGFGVGLSWGCVFFHINKIICSPLIEI